MPTHAETKRLPQSPQQLFDLVADIENYPKFLPWCVACRINRRDGNVIWADLIVGFKMLREKFTSKVTLDRPNRIHVEYLEGPFRYLNNHWTFTPLPDGGTEIGFYIDFEFRSKMLQGLMGAVFNEAVKRMVGAFVKRADEVYGGAPQGATPTAR
ncbi:MAG TPA: type II toxin-antitoxin system RatA family toxin [Magnetospirillaceae bacterium]|jgi:coenzyme Q-binding protein COQ10